MNRNTSIPAVKFSARGKKTADRGHKRPPLLSGGIAVLVSGRGSNLRAILESAQLEGKVSAVFSDNPNAPALDIADEYGIPKKSVVPTDFSSRADFDSALGRSIEEYEPAMVALAGFMRILGAEFVARFQDRLVNIHPSLLPDFRGLDTHRRVYESGQRFHGCTVHWVSEEVDAGDIIDRRKVKVRRLFDTPETLAEKVLAEEHQLYPATLARLLRARQRNARVRPSQQKAPPPCLAEQESARFVVSQPEPSPDLFCGYPQPAGQNYAALHAEMLRQRQQEARA